MDEKIKVARLSIISNTFLTTGKLTVGIFMGSVSIISEAIHSGLDLLAAIIAFLSVRQSAKPADELHKYGHGKFENLAAILEALLIIAAAAGILWHAIQKILQGSGEIVALELGLLIMGISCAVNWIISSKLMKVGKKTDSPALVADAWHLRTDVYTSLGVFVGIILIMITGKPIIDPIIAIFVALLILKAAFDLMRESINSILDAKLPKEEEEVIKAVLDSYNRQIVQYHNLRTRKAGPQRHVDLHLVVPRCQNVVSAHRLCDDIENDLMQKLPQSEILIHSEPCQPPQDCEGCQAACDCEQKNAPCTPRSAHNGKQD